MNITISKLTSADLTAVDELMRRYSQALGFLPREALRSYLEKGGVLGTKTDDGQLVGYLLYGANPDYFRITHLCVQDEYSGQGIAKRLVNCLKESADTQKIIKLHCRRDFPADKLWPKLGFVASGERPGRSKEGHLLTLWHLILAPDNQPGLFRATTSDETLDVIIDANIFFDFDKPDRDNTAPSQALLSDFLIDSLNFWITDELFNEINRKDDPVQREKSRTRAHDFFFRQVEPDLDLAEHFEENVRQLLPTQTASQLSDVKQLAKAAASTVKTFVTRDRNLLNKVEKITEVTGLDIVDPVHLIIQHHEIFKRQSYTPERIAGLNFRWQRLASNDLASFPFDSFLQHRETRGRFREKLEPLIVQPEHYRCELLRSGNEIIAIRVLKNSSNKMLISSFARVARSADRALFGRFLITDTVSKSVEINLDMVKFEASGLTPSLIPDLLDMGFVKCSDSFVRFCFSRHLGRKEVLSVISELSPESISKYEDMSDLDLERCCSPLSLETTEQKYFLIPIRPGYAISLIDRRQSGDDLFGGNPDVLLRWDNVYYRRKTRHRMLKPPARILWYVSEDKQVIGVSRLQNVVIDTPKELFKKFKKFGILKWKDLYGMCDGDLSKEIMALRFSHTFLFRERVSLDKLRDVFREDGIGLSLQSPSSVPIKTFRKLLRVGYPNHL